MNDTEFKSVNIAVLTVSDSRSLSDDRSGDTLVQRLRDAGHHLADRAVVKDEEEAIVEKFNEWINNADIDVVLSTGGTGVTGRDVTPEALSRVVDKNIPGFGEVFRWISYQKIKTSTIQSRAAAGVARDTYLFVLPGSPSACRDAWDDILVYQLDIRNMPCNFVELMPRLSEGRSS